MAEQTGIEWCDATFNPWWGCERVSPACAHCYADDWAKRFGKNLWGPGHQFRFFGDEHWAEPLKWARTLPAKLARRPRVFCASMADVFEERYELRPHRERLFELIDATPELDWLLLTKRPEFARDYWAALPHEIATLANVWMGVSIENARYTWRADVLREVPAAIRFVSAEPLLGSLFEKRTRLHPHAIPRDLNLATKLARMTKAPLDLSGIDWVIIGGESGPRARPFHLDDARELIDAALEQCGTCERVMGRDAVARACERGESRPYGLCDRTTAVFVKQLGADPRTVNTPTLRAGKRLRDRKGGDWNEWPADLRIREFPTGLAVPA